MLEVTPSHRSPIIAVVTFDDTSDALDAFFRPCQGPSLPYVLKRLGGGGCEG